MPQPTRPQPEGAPDRVVGTAINMMRRGFETLMQRIQDCEKPVIVALNGTAAGGGAMLTLAADLVIAADNAKIIQIFVRRGLIPDGGVAYLLPRLVGLHKAKELIFFGDDLSAADAETARHREQGRARRRAAGDREGVGGTARRAARRRRSAGRRRCCTTRPSCRVATILEEEAMLVEINSMTEDSGEGVAAFRERRPPEWKGW